MREDSTMTLPTEIRTMGFESTAAFQRAWALGPRLVADGIAGPVTLAAARTSAARRARGLGDLSAHFSAAEFRCHCGGKSAECAGVLVTRELLQALEVIRDAVDRSVQVVSGYRCPAHNRAVGGAGDSQHMHGTAADLPATLGLTVPKVRALHVARGIGSGARSGQVVHVDVRAGASALAPALWTYPGQ
jgi:zinc D-Ala-D-Ala carboxypeptidase